MTPTRQEVIRVARECGAFLELSTTPEKDMAFLLRFAERFYEAGAAAAREPLVEALKGLLDDTQHVSHVDCDEGPCPVRDAREALAKATGEKA